MKSLGKIKSLTYLLRNHSHKFNHDNLHRIAIANLSDPRRRQERWWSKKYGKPLKAYHDHTDEELWIEQLEDFYDANPVEIQRFLDAEANRIEDGWDGRMSKEYEEAMQKRLKKHRQVDISKYQSDEKLTEEQEAEILKNLGLSLPKSRKLNSGSPIKSEKHEVQVLGEEFDDDFGGEP